MKTFADPNDPAETQWLYDEPTGLLTNKVYDDGNGPTYSYYPNGKLQTRVSARGTVTTNTYNNLGQLISTTYSDGTPLITKQYNRLGQLTKVTQATATDQRITTYDYDTNTFALLSESINGTNIISYSYNSRGQQTGYSSGNAEPQLGNYLAVTQVTFDEFGRPATLQSVFGSESKADFIRKLAIAQKECNETIYWLELLYKTKYINNAQFESINTDAVELIKLLTSIIKTTKSNINN